MKKLIISTLIFLFISSCSSFTGPNRKMKMVSANTATDFITFEGSITKICTDTLAEIMGDIVVIGCTLKARPVSSNERDVFCALNNYRECKKVPLGARFSVDGFLMSESVIVQATKIKWTTK